MEQPGREERVHSSLAKICCSGRLELTQDENDAAYFFQTEDSSLLEGPMSVIFNRQSSTSSVLQLTQRLFDLRIH